VGERGRDFYAVLGVAPGADAREVMALAESAQMCSAKVLSGGRVEAASS
jgi:hypothetical protein